MAGSQLSEWLQSVRDRKFIWGIWDCQVWASEWARRKQGKSPSFGPFPYSCEISAQAWFEAQGGFLTTAGKIMHRNGLSSEPRAVTGSIICCDGPAGPILGIAETENLGVFLGPKRYRRARLPILGVWN